MFKCSGVVTMSFCGLMSTKGYTTVEYARKYFPTHLRGCKSRHTLESRDHNGLSRLLQQPTEGLYLLCKC